MGVDVGSWEYHQRTQQSAVDSAALGGAQQLTYSNCTGSSAAITAAQNDAANSGYAAGGNVTLTVQTPPQSGPYAGNSCAVAVQITNAKVPSYFARFFGKSSGVTESTSAVAVASQKNNGLRVHARYDVRPRTLTERSMNAPSCSIYLNGSGNFNGWTINAGSIGEGNFRAVNNGGSFTGGQSRRHHFRLPIPVRRSRDARNSPTIPRRLQAATRSTTAAANAVRAVTITLISTATA